MGGRNGNYRAIVLCPDHLCKKWIAELEETIPGIKLTMFDVAGKVCKHLISDMTRLYDRMKRPGGRWKKPQGAEWYILGRDQAKFLPAGSSLGNKRWGFGSVVGRLGGRHTIVQVGEVLARMLQDFDKIGDEPVESSVPYDLGRALC
jgi:hypothetical protein